MNLNFDVTLNVIGLPCPMPVLHAKRALQKLKQGQILQLLMSDPVVERDIVIYADKAGHRIVGRDADRNCYRVFLEKA